MHQFVCVRVWSEQALDNALRYECDFEEVDEEIEKFGLGRGTCTMKLQQPADLPPPYKIGQTYSFPSGSPAPTQESLFIRTVNALEKIADDLDRLTESSGRHNMMEDLYIGVFR